MNRIVQLEAELAKLWETQRELIKKIVEDAEDAQPVTVGVRTASLRY